MSTSECGAIGFSHEEVMWPILSLNNDLEWCDDKKLIECIKITLHPKFEMKCIKGKYSMALRFFNEVVILTAISWRTYSCPLNNMATKTSFCLYLVKCLIVTPKCAVNATSSFQQFPRSLKCLWSKLFLLFPLGLSLYIIIARWKNKFLEK